MGQVIDLSGKLAGVQDAYPVLQGAVDAVAYNVPTLFLLPPGSVNLSHSVVADKQDVRFQAPGKGITTVACYAGPAFVFGAERGTGTAANWVPTKLDATAGARFGFASNGDTILQLANHPVCWGGKSKADPNVSDHWADLAEYTLEIAFDPMGNQVPLFCLGRNYQQPEGPWVEFTLLPNGMGLIQVFWRDRAGRLHNAVVQTAATGVKRLALVWGNGKLTARMEGQPVPINGDTDFNGFARGTGAYPLHCGTKGFAPTDGNAPKFVLYGLKASTVARPDAGNDWGRYFDPTTPGCVVTFGGIRDSAPGRIVPFFGPNWQRSNAWAWKTTNADNFVSGNALTGMSVVGGVALGQVCDFVARDVSFRGGPVGLGTMPRHVSYPLLFDHSDFFGTEAGLQLAYAVNASLRDCHVYSNGLGNCYARFVGCSVAWDGGFCGVPSANGRSGVEHFGFECGGAIRLSDLCMDNEGVAFGDSAVYVEDSIGLPTSLDLSGVIASRLGPNAAFLRLGSSEANPAKRNTVDARGLSLSGGGGNSSVRVDSATWKGTVGYAGNLPVTGPGAAGVKPQ